jgi:hypothetical protein
MTWTATLLPDDALPPDSLVKRILDADKVQQAAMVVAQQFMEEYADDFKALAAIEKADLEPSPPLWRLMEKAYVSGEHATTDGRSGTAAEIETLRDWLLPEEHLTPMLPDGYDGTVARWQERQRLRAILTEQARIARAEP